MRNIILFLFILTHTLVIHAHYDMNENCRKAYGEIIQLKFNSGRKLLSNEKSINPSNNIPYYLDNYIDFLIAIIGEEDIDFIKLKENLPARIKKLEEGDQSSPYYNYCIAEVYFQWGLTRIKFKEYVSGFYEINKAFRLLEDNSRKFPDFVPNLKSLGMMHILIGTIKDNYKWLRTILPDEASTSQGINEIKKILNISFNNKDYHYLKAECLFIYTYVMFNILKNYEDIPELLPLYYDTTSYSTVTFNPFLKYSLAKIYIHSGKNDEAIEILTSYKTDNNTYPFYYMDYLTGRAKLNRLDKDSYKYFFRFLQNFTGKYYLKSAYQKLAWYYLVSENNDKYIEYITRVLHNGSEIIDADKQAQFEAKSGVMPNIKLFKARLLFDGGYYSRALEVISDIDKETELTIFKDSLEYSYRKARIFHRSERISEAIFLYKKTLTMGSEHNYYFAANSALKLAQIYEEREKFKDAEYYYKKCLKLHYSEYRNGISLDAKAGLSRID